MNVKTEKVGNIIFITGMILSIDFSLPEPNYVRFLTHGKTLQERLQNCIIETYDPSGNLLKTTPLEACSSNIQTETIYDLRKLEQREAA